MIRQRIYYHKPKRSMSKALIPARKPQFLLNLQGKPPVPLWLPEQPYGQARPFLKLSDVLIGFSLFLATLACACSAYAFGQTNALAARTAAVSQISWPTSTRTPLPSLTPTLTQSQLAGTAAPPVPANVPGPAAPPASPAPLLSAALPSTSTDPSIGGLPAVNSADPGLQPLNLPPVSQAAVTGTLPAAPTALATQITLPTLPPGAPAATATPGPTATPANPATPTPTPATGWSFASVRLDPGQEDGLLLYGNMINDTGTPQELEAVTGAFYDAEGRLIAGEGSIYDYWPINVVPPGGRVPFELTVFDGQNAANFNLIVEAAPSDENTRQDFEFLSANQRNEDGDYCLEGELRNPGDELEEYLVIVAILYDAQGNVINFDYYDEYAPENIKGDQTSYFDICVSPLDQGVATHELRAWGQ